MSALRPRAVVPPRGPGRRAGFLPGRAAQLRGGRDDVESRIVAGRNSDRTSGWWPPDATALRAPSVSLHSGDPRRVRDPDGPTAGRADARIVFVRPPGVDRGWERSGLGNGRGDSGHDGLDRRRRSRGDAVRSRDLRRGAAVRRGRHPPLQGRHHRVARPFGGQRREDSALEALVAGQPSALASTPVYGCQLLMTPACCGKDDKSCAR